MSFSTRRKYDAKRLTPAERMESLADRNKAQETSELKSIYKELKEDEYSDKHKSFNKSFNKSFSTRR